MEEIPELKAVRDAFLGSDVVIIQIDLDPIEDTIAELLQYRTDNGITWAIAPDTADVATAYGVDAAPWSFIIDINGWIQKDFRGLATSREFINSIKTLPIPPTRIPGDIAGPEKPLGSGSFPPDGLVNVWDLSYIGRVYDKIDPVGDFTGPENPLGSGKYPPDGRVDSWELIDLSESFGQHM